MLILSRRINESIIIGDNVKVTLLSTDGMHIENVRIGIEAPKTLLILREEVWMRLKKVSQFTQRNSFLINNK